MLSALSNDFATRNNFQAVFFRGVAESMPRRQGFRRSLVPTGVS
jgi:hypothetical protein